MRSAASARLDRQYSASRKNPPNVTGAQAHRRGNCLRRDRLRRPPKLRKVIGNSVTQLSGLFRQLYQLSIRRMPLNQEAKR